MRPPLKRIALERLEVYLGRPIEEVEKIRLEILDGQLYLLESALDLAKKAESVADWGRAGRCFVIAGRVRAELLGGGR